MPGVLLRPHILSFKNRLKGDLKERLLGRHFFLAATLVGFFVFLLLGCREFFTELFKHEQFNPKALSNLLEMGTLSFFALLVFSSCIAALSYLFNAKDIPLLLSAPVSTGRIYLSRLISIVFNASSMLAVFAIPMTLAFGLSLNAPWHFYPVALSSAVALIIIAGCLGILFTLALTNLVSPNGLKNVIAIIAFAAIGGLILLDQKHDTAYSTDTSDISALLEGLNETNAPSVWWSPVTQLTDSLMMYVTGDFTTGSRSTALLIAIAIFSLVLSYNLFSYFYIGGWNSTLASSRKHFAREWSLLNLLSILFFPFGSQFRAIFQKEARMFIRDTTQSLQLLLLLLLTFIYLYNFKTLQMSAELSEENFSWWHAVLSTANIGFGACVMAAITTRFVFPSVSLEGRAYSLLRSSPLSIRQILWQKYFTWLIPISLLASILLISGALAIGAPAPAIIATGFIALSLSCGIVGLGIGIGAIFARFDWDNPAQVTASFGSLVFMLLAICCITLTSIPAILIFVLTCVPQATAKLSASKFHYFLTFNYSLIFAINYFVAQRALRAGENRLIEMEN